MCVLPALLEMMSHSRTIHSKQDLILNYPSCPAWSHCLWPQSVLPPCSVTLALPRCPWQHPMFSVRQFHSTGEIFSIFPVVSWRGHLHSGISSNSSCPAVHQLCKMELSWCPSLENLAISQWCFHGKPSLRRPQSAPAKHMQPKYPPKYEIWC